MSGDLRERGRLKALHPEIYRDGELAGLDKLPPGTRERGGYPIGFHQWPLDRRNAWFAGRAEARDRQNSRGCDADRRGKLDMSGPDDLNPHSYEESPAAERERQERETRARGRPKGAGREAPLYPEPRFRTVREFCGEYKPVAEVVGGGVLQSGGLYTLTAKTGTGKTSWMVTTALAGVTGRADILGREVMQGRYAICTAENQTACGCDSRWRFLGTSTGRSRPRPVNLRQPRAAGRNLRISRRAKPAGPFHRHLRRYMAGVFRGRDANNPTEAVNFTKRFRPLATCPGRRP